MITVAYQCKRINKECDDCGQCEPEPPKCPVCDAECEVLYKDINGEIFGCDECVREVNIWDY